MHVLHWVAVEADNAEEALSSAKHSLETIMSDSDYGSTWYDWFVPGGGRWNPNEGSQYDDNDFSMVISAADKDKFIAQIDKCMDNRKQEFANYRKEYEERAVDINAKLDSYDGNMDYSFELYPLAKMIDMFQGNWDFNSYYFDIIDWSTNPKHILNRIETNNAENIFLVPIDFHF